ncbi:MAG: DUF4185 domain-containing protein [Myxococcales bacterium]|nr:DUF4185 domain-containing protein [Myxococcales bacterium]
MIALLGLWSVACGDDPASCNGCADTGDASAEGDAMEGGTFSKALEVASVEDWGVVPFPSDKVVGRDGGYAGLLGGKLLWLFGDTFLTKENPVDDTFVLSATSGWSTLADPTTLVEPVDEDGFPAQTIPYTAGELDKNKTDALNGWSLWPGTMIDTGDPEGLVFFQRIKRTEGMGFDSMGVGTARIALDATTATRNSGDLFAPPERLYMPTSVVEGFAYGFACESVGFLDTECRMTRVLPADADTRSAYQFFDGAEWQADADKAAVVVGGIGGQPSLSYNPHLGRYLAVASSILSSKVVLMTSERIEGPWEERVKFEPDGVGYLDAVDDAYNYIVIEHPELRSTDGKTIVISYSRPTAPFQGEIRLMRVTLK